MQLEDRSTALASRDLARALDPSLLMRDAGLVPDDWQADLLQSPDPRIIIAAARQVGKSTTVASKALHVALYEPSSLVLLLSPSLRQSSELFRKCMDVYRAVDGLPDSSAESALRIEFPNGSRVVSLPGGDGGITIRGYSKPRLVVMDEGAYLSDDLISATLPMLAASPNGQLIVMSSPNGLRGFFADVWHNGDESWKRIKVTWRDCPRLNEDAVQLVRQTVGELTYRQEFEVEFLDSQLTVFPVHLVDAAFDMNTEAWAI